MEEVVWGWSVENPASPMPWSAGASLLTVSPMLIEFEESAVYLDVQDDEGVQV